MKIVRWLAVAVTALMALMNLGVALGASDTDVSVAWVVGAAVLFVLGATAAVGLALGTSWGPLAVVAAGVLNLVGGVVALAGDQEGAVIGITVAALGAALSLATTRRPTSLTPA